MEEKEDRKGIEHMSWTSFSYSGHFQKQSSMFLGGTAGGAAGEVAIGAAGGVASRAASRPTGGPS